eukprot:10061910-Alexandrium_andersonii.AAC.1
MLQTVAAVCSGWFAGGCRPPDPPERKSASGVRSSGAGPPRSGGCKPLQTAAGGLQRLVYVCRYTLGARRQVAQDKSLKIERSLREEAERKLKAAEERVQVARG